METPEGSELRKDLIWITFQEYHIFYVPLEDHTVHSCVAEKGPLKCTPVGLSVFNLNENN